tara:strand:- start:328 stop:606 length:279 start_codon:yes stop_codon:yes gene_type:complete
MMYSSVEVYVEVEVSVEVEYVSTELKQASISCRYSSCIAALADSSSSTERARVILRTFAYRFFAYLMDRDRDRDREEKRRNRDKKMKSKDEE